MSSPSPSRWLVADRDLVILDDGSPALLLQGATIRDHDTKSGNPNHVIGSGKFGSGPGQKDRRKTGVDRRVAPSRRSGDGQRPDQIRRRDAVVDAAREVEDITDERSMREFMRRRWTGTRAMTDADVTSFIADVRSQRIDDVIDALDNRVRSGVLKRSKVANISFPRGWVKATMRGLTDPEILQVLNRLRSRGWSEQDVRQHVVNRFDDDRKRLARARADIEVD